MAANRYRYNKKSGALQEAMVSNRLNVDEDMIQQQRQTNSLSLGDQTLAAARMPVPATPAGVVGTGLDPSRSAGRYSLLFYTVEEGQRIIAVEQSGKMTIIEGPARVWRRGRQFRPMQHYVAHPGEFLIVRFRDGRQEHLPGPAHCWLDPREHLSVEKEEVVQIANEEAVVVYSDTDGTITRRIAGGPATFIPAPGEWLHTFSWHGSVGGLKVPNALIFQKLWLLPDQMYHDVAEVRTGDDAVLTIRLMIFFQLIDIEQMMATSHDPIGDFVNAATSDVVEFVRRHSFDEFKLSCDQLNALATYRQLVERASQCGYRIDNVVYRGYGAPPALQQMHEKATESRTRLQLEKATEQQAQELEDLKQERALVRAGRGRSEERDEFEHRVGIKRRELEEALAAEAAHRESARGQAHLDATQTIALTAAEDVRKQAHYARLSELGVDLTALLTAVPPDRVIELRGAESGHIHLDE
ncbi:MAG: hypothetical protein ACI8RZ_005835 [Myxococcota bacterium]|jgi:hypothetical protein